MSILSISIVDLLAHLLGKGKLNILASRSSKLGDTLLRGLGGVFNLRNCYALLLSKILTADSWERDRFVDTGLDWLRVGNLNSWLNRGDNRNIVASFLGNFLTVVVSIAVVSITWGRLADGHHLGITLLLERDLNSLGSCGFSLLLVGVGADLVVNDRHTLGTDSPGDRVALLSVNDNFSGDFDVLTDSLKSRGADLSRFNYILN